MFGLEIRKRFRDQITFPTTLCSEKLRSDLERSLTKQLIDLGAHLSLDRSHL